MTNPQPTGPRWQHPEPPTVDDVVIMVVIGSLVFWGLVLLSPLFHSAPSTAPVGAMVIGMPLLFFNALIAVVTVESVWLRRTEEFNQRVSQLKTWRTNLEAAEQRRQQEAAGALRRRAEARQQAHAETIRRQNVRLEIAQAEQRVQRLEAEHAAADVKIKEAS